MNATTLAWLALLLAPLLLLGPCLFGSRTFVPFDVAQWPPVSTMLTPEQQAEVARGDNKDPTEIPLTFTPELEFAQQELAAGRLPEWNPYARGGAPLLATAVVGLLYPLHWVYLIPDDPADGYAWGAYLGFVIAGLLMWGFLRALKLDALPALFGALAFMFSGTMFANVHFYQRFDALIWLPGMLWAVLRLSERSGRARLLPLLGLAACVAMTWLAGFPPYAAPATLVAGIYGAVLAVRLWRSDGRPAGVRFGGAFAAALALGFGLAAVQLLPMFAFFPESNRSVAPAADKLASEAFDPAGLLGYVMPDPFGHPTAGVGYEYSPVATYLFSRRNWDTGALFTPQSFNYVEYTVFPGTLVLLLAVIALMHRGVRFRGVAAGTLALLLVLSFASVWLAWLHLLPGMRNVPPKRFLGPCCALVAILAAIGLQQLTTRIGRRRWLGLCIGAAVVSGLCFAGYASLSARTAEEFWSLLREPIWDAYRAQQPDLAVGVVDSFVGTHSPNAQRLLVDNLWYGGVAFLLGAAWLAVWPVARIDTRARAALLGAAFVGTVLQLVWLASSVAGGRELKYAVDSDVHAFLRERRAEADAVGGFTVARAGGAKADLPWLLPPCTLVPDHIRDLNIYTFIDGQSHKPIAALYPPPKPVLFGERWVMRLPDNEKLKHPLLDLLGVRYLLSDVPMVHGGTLVGPQLRGPSGEFFVYERESALPRAFWVPAARELPDEQSVLAAMASPDFAPRAAVLLTPDQMTLLSSSNKDSSPSTPATRDVRFIRDDSNDIVLAVGPGPTGFVVVTDTHMTGWTAFVNDAPAPLARGFVSMRVVPVPAGPCEVRLRYRTPRLDAGLTITMASIVAMLVLLVLFLGWRSRQPVRE